MSEQVHGHAITPVLARQPGPIIRLMALGAGLWGIGVLTVHEAAPLEIFSPWFSGALLLLTVPVTWLTLRLVRRVAGRDCPDPFVAMGIASVPALLLDGVALTWMPTLYSAVEPQQRAAAAWLLWFVGVGLALSLIVPMRQRDTSHG